MFAACTCLLALMALGRRTPFLFVVCGAAAAFWTWRQGHALRGSPPPAEVMERVGRLVRGLLFFQAALCALGNAPVFLTIALVVMLPITALIGKRYAPS
jgi:hypothetical protein